MKSPVVLAVMCILCAFAKDKAPITAGCLAMAFYLLSIKKDRRSLVFAAVILMGILVPRYECSAPAINTGRVVHISSGSFWLQRGRKRVLVYSDANVILDSTVRVEGTGKPLQSTPGFFRFDFAAWGKRNGMDYSVRCDAVEVLRPSRSLRGKLQQAILNMDDPELQALSMRILFGIRGQQNLFESQLETGGFSLSGVILLLRMVLELLCKEKQRNRIEFVFCLLLGLVFHFPLLLVSRLIASALSFVSWKGPRKTAAWVIAVLLWKPESAYSAAFLMPCVIRAASTFSDRSHRRSAALFFSLLLQSVLFHQVYPFTMLGFSFVMKIKGGFWLLALASVMFQTKWIRSVYGLDKLLALFERFRFNGSILGAGLLLFVIAFSFVYHLRHRYRYGIVLLLVFLKLNLFHPFAEVTAINVGQGTSILLKGPFNTSAILLDTGKPSEADHVAGYLRAKGVTHLDALILSHGDLDHAGGVDELSKVFQPKQIIHAHQKQIQAGIFTFYDLNELKNEDENQSSLVLYTEINGVRYLCMADADRQTEKVILKQYGNLRADVLMLAHHGSATGNSEDFLNTVRPDVGIISCGPYSLYHHPSPVVVQRLLKRHIPYLVTRQEGDISFLAAGPFNLVWTSAGTIGLLAPSGGIIDP